MNIIMIIAGNLIYIWVDTRSTRVGIATHYELEGPGNESQCGRDFPHPSRTALGPTLPPIQLVPGLSREKSGRGVTLTTHPT
jgi:hypothetical protein